MQNAWRRTYPGCLVVHGGLFYDVETEEWIAITCRQAHVGYRLNIADAGEGVGYDFLLLFFPQQDEAPPNTKFFPARDLFQLPPPWDDVVRFRGKFSGAVFEKDTDCFFRNVVADVYEMERD